MTAEMCFQSMSKYRQWWGMWCPPADFSRAWNPQ